MEKHDNVYMKRHNKKQVLTALKSRRPVPRAELARMTGMSAMSISRIVQELEAEGYIRCADSVSSGVGRRADLLDIRGEAVHAVGVDLAEHEFAVGILNFADELVRLDRWPKPVGERPEETLGRIAEAIGRALKDDGIGYGSVCGVGIGMPGLMGPGGRTVVQSVQLGWTGVPIVEQLERLTGLRVVADNDLKMLAMAESLRGASAGAESSVLIGIGSGVGSAILTKGGFYRGERNMAGEIAHIVVDLDGDRCGCGKIGCLNTLVTEKAIVRYVRDTKPVGSLDEAAGLYRQGDERAVRAFDRAASGIAAAVVNSLLSYDPELVVLSGPVVDDYPELRALISEKCKQMLPETHRDRECVRYARLGKNGMVTGAALHARYELFDAVGPAVREP